MSFIFVVRIVVADVLLSASALSGVIAANAVGEPTLKQDAYSISHADWQRAAISIEEAFSIDTPTPSHRQPSEPSSLTVGEANASPGYANSSSDWWSVAPAAEGSAWWHAGTQAFQLHSQPFLRLRSPSASTIEGVNRAMVEFKRPVQRVERVELWLSGRDSTEPRVKLVGYAANGHLDDSDASLEGSMITTFQQLRREPTVIDVTEFVNSQSALGVSHIGFRMQLIDEANAPIGLNVRAEWNVEPVLVIYPTCYADCDTASGTQILDVFDFICFQAEFTAGSPYACDCDTSTGVGVCDLFDILCFQQAFLAECG